MKLVYGVLKHLKTIAIPWMLLNLHLEFPFFHLFSRIIFDGTIKFYCQYVDDTLLVVKPQDISCIHKLLNSFDKNLKFTIDLFENEVPHFPDLKMSPDGISIYRKDTNTGLYVNYTTFVPWTHRTAWIRSLVTHALKSNNNKLSQESKLIKKLISWNHFPNI